MASVCCSSFTRRAFLKATSGGIIAISLSSLINPQVVHAEDPVFDIAVVATSPHRADRQDQAQIRVRVLDHMTREPVAGRSISIIATHGIDRGQDLAFRFAAREIRNGEYLGEFATDRAGIASMIAFDEETFDSGSGIMEFLPGAVIEIETEVSAPADADGMSPVEVLISPKDNESNVVGSPYSDITVSPTPGSLETNPAGELVACYTSTQAGTSIPISIRENSSGLAAETAVSFPFLRFLEPDDQIQLVEGPDVPIPLSVPLRASLDENTDFDELKLTIQFDDQLITIVDATQLDPSIPFEPPVLTQLGDGRVRLEIVKSAGVGAIRGSFNIAQLRLMTLPGAEGVAALDILNIDARPISQFHSAFSAKIEINRARKRIPIKINRVQLTEGNVQPTKRELRQAIDHLNFICYPYCFFDEEEISEDAIKGIDFADGINIRKSLARKLMNDEIRGFVDEQGELISNSPADQNEKEIAMFVVERLQGVQATGASTPSCFYDQQSDEDLCCAVLIPRNRLKLTTAAHECMHLLTDSCDHAVDLDGTTGLPRNNIFRLGETGRRKNINVTELQSEAAQENDNYGMKVEGSIFRFMTCPRPSKDEDTSRKFMALSQLCQELVEDEVLGERASELAQEMLEFSISARAIFDEICWAPIPLLGEDFLLHNARTIIKVQSNPPEIRQEIIACALDLIQRLKRLELEGVQRIATFEDIRSFINSQAPGLTFLITYINVAEENLQNAIHSLNFVLEDVKYRFRSDSPLLDRFDAAILMSMLDSLIRSIERGENP